MCIGGLLQRPGTGCQLSQLLQTVHNRHMGHLQHIKDTLDPPERLETGNRDLNVACLPVGL